MPCLSSCPLSCLAFIAEYTTNVPRQRRCTLACGTYRCACLQVSTSLAWLRDANIAQLLPDWYLLTYLFQVATNITLLCGVPQPILPHSWRRVVFDTIHGLALKQPGRWWQHVLCQQANWYNAKVQRHVTAPPQDG